MPPRRRCPTCKTDADVWWNATKRQWQIRDHDNDFGHPCPYSGRRMNLPVKPQRKE